MYKIQKYTLYTHRETGSTFYNSHFSLSPSIVSGNPKAKCIFTEAEFVNTHAIFTADDYFYIFDQNMYETLNPQPTPIATIKPFTRKYYSMDVSSLVSHINNAIIKAETEIGKPISVRARTIADISSSGISFIDVGDNGASSDFSIGLYGNFYHVLRTSKIHNNSELIDGLHEVVFPGTSFVGPTVYQIQTNLMQEVKVGSKSGEEYNIVLMTDNLTPATNNKVQMFGSMVCSASNLDSLQITLRDEYDNMVEVESPIHLELTVYVETENERSSYSTLPQKRFPQ